MTEIGREIVGSNETSLNRIRLVATVIGQLIGAEGFPDRIEEKALGMDEFALGALYASLGQVRRVLIESAIPHRALEVVSAIDEPVAELAPTAQAEIKAIDSESPDEASTITTQDVPQNLVVLEQEPATRLPESIEVLGASLPKTPLKYLYDYFDSTYVDRLTIEHAKPLAEAIANEFYRRFTATRRPKEALIAELEGYFKGVGNDELANLNFMTEASVQVMRSRTFTRLKNELKQEGVDKLIASLFKDDITSALTDKTDEAAAMSSIETSPADDNTAGPEVMPEAQQATSIGVGEYLEDDQEDAEDEHDTFESVIALASQYWSADDIASLKELLDLTSGEADIILARQHISNLMGKYLNYWGKDPANVPKYQWDLLNKLCDYQLTRRDGTPVTFKTANMIFKGPAGTKGLTVEQAFSNAFAYLLSAEIKDFAKDFVSPTTNSEVENATLKPEPTPANDNVVALTQPTPTPEAAETLAIVTPIGAALNHLAKYKDFMKPEEAKILEKHLTGKGGAEYDKDDLLDAASSLRALIAAAERNVSNHRTPQFSKKHKGNLPMLDSKQREILTLLLGYPQYGKQPVAHAQLKEYYGKQSPAILARLPEIKEVPDYLESALHTLFSMMRLH